jgi:hypothetical protein
VSCGGGGAGGTVYLRASTISGGAITATGGLGGTIVAHETSARSDSGGPGRVRVDATTWTGTATPTANRGTPP